MAMYGPKLTMALAYCNRGGKMSSCEMSFTPRYGWRVEREFKIRPELGKVFAPGNLKITKKYYTYRQLVQHWIGSGWRLRYSGGMVPDVYHMLSKGKGVFTNCALSESKAKLRLLYECAPIAFIVEAAGGRTLMDPAFTSKSRRQSVLDFPVRALDQRVGICFGGQEDVKVFGQYMCKL